MRWLGESYFGRRRRPFAEFWALAEARRRGLPVPEPLAAVVERGRWTYRGVLVTAEVPGAVPLPEFLAAGAAPDAAAALGRRLREIHDAGLLHPDLHLGNVLVLPLAHGVDVAFVDLDRARLSERPLGAAARRRGLARLRRSARKIDPAGRLVPEAWLRAVEDAYETAPRRAGGAA